MLKIIVKKDIEKDIALIKRELFDGGENYRQRILSYYKTLAEEIKNKSREEAEEIADNFFRRQYHKMAEDIDEIVKESQEILEDRSEACLNKLVELMDYKIKRDEEFVVIPTLLPYSPFHRPTVYFSLITRLYLGRGNMILDIAIHEISHFLFFDILNEIGADIIKIEPKEFGFWYLFKEALTGMLLSEKELEDLLERKGYKGNPEVENLSVQKEGSADKITLREYLRERLNDHKQNGSCFNSFIKEIISELRPQVEAFEAKNNFWVKNEEEIKKWNQDLIREYEEPILI